MNRLLLAVFAVLVGGALIAGFILTGGLEQGRMEQRDRQRYDDIAAIAQYARCAAGGEALPDAIPQPGFCERRQAPKRLTDPRTDEPYAYRKLGADRFEVCARFEADATLSGMDWPYGDLNFAGETGCLRWTRGENGRWDRY